MASPASPATAMTMARTIAYGNDPATRQGGRSNGGHPALRQRQAAPRDCPTAPSRRGPVGHQSGPGLESPSHRHRPQIPRLCPIVLCLSVRPDPAQLYPTPQRSTCESTGPLCPGYPMQPQPLGSVQRGPYYHIAGGLATSISLFARVCMTLRATGAAHFLSATLRTRTVLANPLGSRSLRAGRWEWSGIGCLEECLDRCWQVPAVRGEGHQGGVSGHLAERHHEADLGTLVRLEEIRLLRRPRPHGAFGGATPT